jgi:SAM-dependent methyltransferase
MDETGAPPAGVGEVEAATRAHFTARAAQYTGGGGETSLRAMLDLVDARPGERVLDVATGTGLVLVPLAERVGGAGLAVGVDFTPAMLAEAARRNRLPALIAAHAGRLPFRPQTFDAVTCRFAVHHFADPETSLAAMAAVLRPGGRLVVADFVRPEDETAGAEHDRLEALRGHVHFRIYSRPRLEAMLAAAGCPVVARRDAEREFRPQDLAGGPNVAPSDREALAEAVSGLEAHGGAGLEARRVDDGVRLVRTDAVLLGIKQGDPSAAPL